MRAWLLLLFAVLASGCRQEQPANPGTGDDAVKPIIAPQPVVPPTPTPEEVRKRLEAESADIYVILPQKKEFIANEFGETLQAELKPFLDEQNPSRIANTGTHWFVKVTTAPVKDVEAFGGKQTVGKVVAFDPAKRALLLEYGATKSPRGDWKGATELDRQVMARSACWGTPPPPRYPPEQVVYVRFRGDWSKQEFAAQVKLKDLLDGPAEKRHAWTVDRSSYFGDWATAVAPVADLGALVKRIDFAEVVFFDAEHRALILGPRK